MNRPLCAGCDGSGWIVPRPGPDDAKRCGCNPNPSTLMHRSAYIGGPSICDSRITDANSGAQTLSFSGAVNCPKCIRRMR